MALKSIVKIAALIVIAVLSYNFHPMNQEEFMGKTVMIKGADGIQINADIYESVQAEAPVILLFHQARYSRGEYREIAPKLVRMGFTCIAVDQRSGKEVNGVVNESAIQAQSLELPTAYIDAYPDLQSTLDYAKKNYKNRKILVWGSSYSSSLVFILASNNPTSIAAILSFSPGEYFEYKDKKIVDYAKEVKCPVFITSAQNEHDSWEAIYEAVPSANKQFYLPASKGFHGSKALWEENAGNEKYWGAVTQFLESLN